MRKRRLNEIAGRRLHEARTAAGLTPSELAAALRCHQRDVGRWEGGESSPPIAYVAGVAELCGVSTDWLLGRAERPRPELPEPSLSPGAVPVSVLRDALLLTHPDRQPEARRAEATRVSQELNALIDRAG